MLQIHDIRESRVIQEVIAEVQKETQKEERERHLQEKLEYVTKMADLTTDPEKIAKILGMEVELVRQELAKHP